MAVSARAEAHPIPERRRLLRAAIVAARPRQWSKNLLLFAGLVFAAKLGDLHRWVEATTAFAAYCAASSASYLLNDVRDAENDRKHPLKSQRPIARSELSPKLALGIAAGLTVVAFALVAPLGVSSVAYLAVFLTLQLAYSLGLKHVVFVDVLTITALFVIRSAAGAAAVDVPISGWLLAVTALLALFLALAKRRSELVGAGDARPVLEGYTLKRLDQLIALDMLATVVTYTAYTLTAHTPLLVLTVPFVAFGLARYLLLVHRDDLGEEPENILLTDRPLVVAVVLWALTAATILATRG